MKRTKAQLEEQALHQTMKLTKAQLKERDAVSRELEEKAQDIQSAVDQYNETVEAAHKELAERIQDYNEGPLSAARAFVESTISTIDEYIGDKSEKWQESERGQAVQAWRDSWDALDLSDVEPPAYEMLEFDIPTHNEDIDYAPEESE